MRWVAQRLNRERTLYTVRSPGRATGRRLYPSQSHLQLERGQVREKERGEAGKKRQSYRNREKGPGSISTPGLMDLLERDFFVLGRWMMADTLPGTMSLLKSCLSLGEGWLCPGRMANDGICRASAPEPHTRPGSMMGFCTGVYDKNFVLKSTHCVVKGAAESCSIHVTYLSTDLSCKYFTLTFLFLFLKHKYFSFLRSLALALICSHSALNEVSGRRRSRRCGGRAIFNLASHHMRLITVTFLAFKVKIF